MKRSTERLIYFCATVFLSISITFITTVLLGIPVLYATPYIVFLPLSIYIFKTPWRRWMRPWYLITWQSMFLVGATLTMSIPLVLFGNTNRTVLLISGLFLYIMGVIQGSRIITRNYGRGDFRIIHVSDLHLGHGLGKRHLQRIFERIRVIEGDAIAIVGDLVEDIDFIDTEFASIISQENRPILFVSGNHEAYMDRVELESRLVKAGITLIDDRQFEIGDVVFHGVCDKGHRIEKLKLPEKVYGKRNILLVHQPPQKPTDFDLTLSGHIHDGQIFPFNFVFRMALKYSAGYYPDAAINVSPGTGSFGGAFRLARPMEISVIYI